MRSFAIFCSVRNFLSIFRHLTLVSYKNYYNTLFSLKQSALFVLSSTLPDYMIRLSVWEGGIRLAKVQIKVNDNGSFRVTGDVELVDSQGNVFPAKPAFSLCRCGLSKNMPYCDASHKGKFESVVRAPEAE
ncbi:CDGSH iron-sulfur domain-containing protein [Bacillus cereus]|nr:CDGSH iron-sulfur domain-containing protein [Bacillus cereus]PEE18167.1 CDGSH iron-sulfur domain-containing protein [Bacillus cereus]PES78131.1 CDGSH iron-sulfur domain-containing protein [Bacillus cereus]PET03195.1 CDGSH iron-sulfur domain-containing protein [Bacillus cereus]PEX51994.1 CDGSH iron-sulfur domain-containing protein [Bacillus cereus]